MKNTDKQKDFKNYLSLQKKIVDESLEKLMPSSETYPSILHESMRYIIFADGKRFRPILSLAVCEACGGDTEAVIKTAAALEMIHTYSLIHDDLPSMDNDDYRRGQLSNHKKYGEDIAILSGDALLSLAFEVMDPRMAPLIAKAIGSQGVVGGQVVDIQLAKGKLDLSESLLTYIHNNKTAKLIQISCLVGAYLSDAPQNIIDNISSYGHSIGFAFQVIDDCFDQDNYAKIFDKETLIKLANNHVSKAKEALNVFEKGKRDTLDSLADFVISRTK
ncbi:hypothetical protein AB834_02610 [PVC group bacterium (ex Bugula neritina AB1)]|nr:hypothetical protein AB834_02610 [PVC group bacterium (ex Bugula neritina AB1)]